MGNELAGERLTGTAGSGSGLLCGARLMPVELRPGEIVTGLTTVVAAPTGFAAAADWDVVELELLTAGG